MHKCILKVLKQIYDKSEIFKLKYKTYKILISLQCNGVLAGFAGQASKGNQVKNLDSPAAVSS